MYTPFLKRAGKKTRKSLEVLKSYGWYKVYNNMNVKNIII